MAEPDAPLLLVAAAEAELIVAEDDPRRAIAACPGAPACSRATVSARPDAARLAHAAPRLLSGATLHVSGCAKGCARRAPADLTLVGENGRYGVVIRGKVRDESSAHMSIDTIIDRLHGLECEGSLAVLTSERLVRAFAEP
jgi:precorrin-3B synthase